MFTGIVSHVGRVISISGGSKCKRITVRIKGFGKVRKGESVCVNGVCLTNITDSRDCAAFDVVAETLRRTNLGQLHEDSPVNIERALRAGDTLGGHFVSGHIDCTGVITSFVKRRGESIMVVKPPSEFLKFIAEKGSVAIDGVSLTVASRFEDRFAVALIPFTLENTILGAKREGDRSNIEVDILARYVAEILKWRRCNH